MYTYTPKGKLVKLPYRATVLDFAFAIHSQVAYRAVGAYIGDLAAKEVPIDYKLQEEDVVCIKTDKNSFPDKSWSLIVTTKKARYELNKFDWEELNYQGWRKNKEIEKCNMLAFNEKRIAELRADLKNMYTKQLLNMLRKYSFLYSDNYWYLASYGDGGIYSEFSEKVTKLLKEELATREHIPNKIESKIIRQKAARKKDTRNSRSRGFRR